jgi:hypothetical protein
MDQRLFAPVALRIAALKVLFELRIGFTPEERQLLKKR